MLLFQRVEVLILDEYLACCSVLQKHYSNMLKFENKLDIDVFIYSEILIKIS